MNEPITSASKTREHLIDYQTLETCELSRLRASTLFSCCTHPEIILSTQRNNVKIEQLNG